jgi:phosphoribosylanthranilate isomerase
LGWFKSTWTKDGFEGELSLSAGYFQAENVTVRFDQHIPPKITSWIDKPPASLCVYANPSEENCTTIEDKDIEKIVHFIDEIAYDTSQFEQQQQYGIIEFLNDSGETYFSVKVHYSKEGQILFLESEKGEKEMKPEGEFFEWTKLEHLIK